MTRTEKLTEMKLAHRKRVAEIRAFEDYTHEARERKVKEEIQKHHEEVRAEEERVTVALKSEVEAAYRKAHGPAPVLDTAAEMRLARIREEVRDELDSKRLDPLRGYEQAMRAGDTERAGVIGKMGPRYLDGFRRVRLAELVEESLPQKDREARQRLQALEREREDLELGLAVQRRARAGGAA